MGEWVKTYDAIFATIVGMITHPAKWVLKS
jgi:hypothetical protein